MRTASHFDSLSGYVEEERWCKYVILQWRPHPRLARRVLLFTTHDHLAIMEGKKRKRESDYPRIIYHTSNRTFDRLFKGTTFISRHGNVVH